jgi:hypothetical protein
MSYYVLPVDKFIVETQSIWLCIVRSRPIGVATLAGVAGLVRFAGSVGGLPYSARMGRIARSGSV